MSQEEFVPVGPQHMPDGIALPIHGPDFARAEPELLEQLERVSAATAAAGLHGMGCARASSPALWRACRGAGRWALPSPSSSCRSGRTSPVVWSRSTWRR